MLAGMLEKISDKLNVLGQSPYSKRLPVENDL